MTYLLNISCLWILSYATFATLHYTFSSKVRENQTNDVPLELLCITRRYFKLLNKFRIERYPLEVPSIHQVHNAHVEVHDRQRFHVISLVTSLFSSRRFSSVTRSVRRVLFLVVNCVANDGSDTDFAGSRVCQQIATTTYRSIIVVHLDNENTISFKLRNVRKNTWNDTVRIKQIFALISLQIFAEISISLNINLFNVLLRVSFLNTYVNSLNRRFNINTN